MNSCNYLTSVQVWMLVQRKWMYLEGIFIGGDIRSQLPEEAKKFDQIDKTFKGIMNETFKQPNIKIGELWLNWLMIVIRLVQN